MSTDKCVLNKRQIKFTLPWDSRLPQRCTFVVRSLLIISSRDCREADSRDTSPRHACLGEVSRKIWLHNFAINNNGGSVPVIFISLVANDILQYSQKRSISVIALLTNSWCSKAERLLLKHAFVGVV